MKLTFHAAALTVALFASPTIAQNMLANPDFEAGLSGWSVFGNAYPQTTSPPQFVANSGVGLVTMFGNFSGGFDVTGIFQEFPANPNETFTIEAYSRHWSGDALTGSGAPAFNWVVMKIAFFDAGNAETGAAEATILDGTSPTDTWIYNPPVSGTAPANTVKVQAFILFLQPANDGGAAQIDDVTFLGPPPQMPTYPGTGDDFVLSTAVGGAPLSTGAGNDVKQAPGFSLLAVNIASPNGALDLTPYWVLAQAFPTGNSPVAVPGLPAYFDFLQPIAFLVDGGVGSPTGPPVIAPGGGSTAYFLTPSGMAGLSMMIQGFAFSVSTTNGVYAITDGHEVQFQ
ncbi:MAG: hypothetical protein H6834_05405 [Planctomycetes bacterium]|nr:hypothetical protein [Planctomycetota bacterium]